MLGGHKGQDNFWRVWKLKSKWCLEGRVTIREQTLPEGAVENKVQKC